MEGQKVEVAHITAIYDGERRVFKDGERYLYPAGHSTTPISDIRYAILPRFPRAWTDISSDSRISTCGPIRHSSYRGERPLGQQRNGVYLPLTRQHLDQTSQR